MTKSERKGKDRRIAFHSIEGDGAEAIESIAEEVVRRRRIPSLVPPTEAAPPVDGAAVVSKAGSIGVAPSDGGRYVKVWCPDYLLDEIYARARAQRATLSYIVRLALSQAGYTVNQSDLVPDGRARGKSRK